MSTVIAFPKTSRAQTAYRALRAHHTPRAVACDVVARLEHSAGDVERMRAALVFAPVPIEEHTPFLEAYGYTEQRHDLTRTRKVALGMTFGFAPAPCDLGCVGCYALQFEGVKCWQYEDANGVLRASCRECFEDGRGLRDARGYK